MSMITKELVEANCTRADPTASNFLLGYLYSMVRTYLRGESTREHLTAEFAQLTMSMPETWQNVLATKQN
jgi:hypothetical protein